MNKMKKELSTLDGRSSYPIKTTERSNKNDNSRGKIPKTKIEQKFRKA